MIENSRILLIATRQIGDVLLVTPLLRTLRRAYPKAIIDVLVYQNKGGMLVGNPDYNTCISVAEHPRFTEYYRLLTQILRRYDLAISTLCGDRPLIYALLAAPRRIAVVPPLHDKKTAWKRWLTQVWTPLDNETTHTLVQNLRLADLLKIQRCYEVIVPQPLKTDAERLNQLLPFAWQTEAYVVIHLLPMWHYKRWTIKGFKTIIRYLIQKRYKVVLTGGKHEVETDYFQTIIAEESTQLINLAGQLSFSEVAQLLKSAYLYLGPDTAVTHLAAATGVLTVALYGPTNPLKWAPWPYGYATDETPFKHKGTQRIGNVVLIQGTDTCVPCHQEGCERHKRSSSRCLETLDGETVIAVLDPLLNGKNH